MQEIKLRKDYGNNQTQERLAGKFLTEEAYEEIISATEDTVIFKPGASLYDDVPLAYVVCDAYPDTKVLDCLKTCLLYTSPSPRDLSTSRMPSSA